MAQPVRTSDAAEILRRRYVGKDPQRAAEVEKERINAEVAGIIYELRTDAGLTQKDLADLVGTTQSVISRLEDSDYDGHSLSMLTRIAKALNQRLSILVTSDAPENGMLRYAFRLVLRNLRLTRGLSIEGVATECEIDPGELEAIERSPSVRPSPRTLDRLAQFYGIPTRQLALLAGPASEVPEYVRESAAKFAACSESVSKLSNEEKQLLEEFLGFLRSEVKKS